MNKATLVLGASKKPHRYSNLAARQLQDHKNDVILIGNREGKINDMPILTVWPDDKDVHTITMYLSAKNQLPYYDHILNSGAERIIFNPGAENAELAKIAVEKGIVQSSKSSLYQHLHKQSVFLCMELSKDG